MEFHPPPPHTFGSGKNDKILTLNGEYKKYWKKIERRENFALVRYGDGERALMVGREIHAQEGWSAGNVQTELGKALVDSLNVENKNFVYAVSCPCCDSEAYYWYLQNIKSRNITFANIWVNSNFAEFWKDFQNLKCDAILITNHNGKGKKFGKLNVKKHYFVSDDCVKFWEEEGKKFIQQIISEVGNLKNHLFAISADPMSGLIVKALFENNPNNCYIDFGSSIDMCIHEKITRPYMNPESPYAKQKCWMFNPQKVSTDVDVVLSAYKRPEVLAKQFEAIKNQTLKPRKIFLYQDAVQFGDKVILDENILKQLDGYQIAEENGGVWKRFEYAAKVTKSPYVCVFDDDTIPGRRWLENCHMNMIANDGGIFGTNGVILTGIENYPVQHIPVGWHVSNEETFEVDFVGHSWFFKKEYLNWMLAKPYKKNFKYAAEDMCLSSAAQEHGVKTFVPQHPRNILSLWGSIPQYGNVYGNTAAALWLNPNSINTMKQALYTIHNGGWKFLMEREHLYFNMMLAQHNTKNFHNNALIVLREVGNIFKHISKEKPNFIGEKKFEERVTKLFNLQPNEYRMVENIQQALNFVDTRTLNILFTDFYDQLKPNFENAKLAKNKNFVDGRHLLAILDVMN